MACIDNGLQLWKLKTPIKTRSSNKIFFCQMRFGILGFEIEIEKMFILGGILTTLRCCHFQVQNLD